MVKEKQVARADEASCVWVLSPLRCRVARFVEGCRAEPGPRDEQRGSESPVAVLYLFVSKESVRGRASRGCKRWYYVRVCAVERVLNQSYPQLESSPQVPPISRCETMLCWEMLLGRRLIMRREKRFWCSSLGGGGGGCSS